MTIIGIDLSKNSPGVCIRQDDKLTFISFIRDSDRKRTKEHFDSLRKADVKIVFNERRSTEKEYSKLEGWKTEDATLLSETILENLPDTADLIGLEGFSYGSKGNAGLDIAGYSYCLRKGIYQKYGRNKLAIFSPGNVKKVAGKGNAGKEEMLQYFKDSKDEDLIKTDFWKGILDSSIKYEKPVDDLIDSAFIQECTRRYFLSL